ncbi:MAG: helix-turn-helix domain-containing protein [Planctomycetes bacterium]|nr:helix-turn-helix domain-containing protein [Planctomycetota bacterium]
MLPEDGVDLEQLEHEFVRQALNRTGGNRAQAARLLGMNRDQMRYRIKKFDLVEFQDDEG